MSSEVGQSHASTAPLALVSSFLWKFRQRYPVPSGELFKRTEVCGLCGSREAEKLSEIQYWDLADATVVRCRQCGHIQLDPMLTGEVMNAGCLALYRHQQKSETTRSRRRGFYRAFRKGVAFGISLKRRGIQPQRILEVGAGDAYFMIGLKNVFPDAECTCLDIVQEILDAIKEKHGFATICSSLEEMDQKSVRGFDLIVARDILEHVSQPRKVLENLFQALDPGGHLYFITPNGWQDAWQSFSRWQQDGVKSELLINHVNYYDALGLRQTLKSIGFEVCAWYIYDFKTFFRGAGWRFLEQHKSRPAAARSAAEVIADTRSLKETVSEAVENPIPAAYSWPVLRPLLHAYCYLKHTPILRVDPLARVGEEIFCLAQRPRSATENGAVER